MCELLVWVMDKEPAGDPVTDLHRPRRGDVIVACPDGHPWSQAERTHPRWVIIKVPGMTLAEGEALTHMEPGDGVSRFRHARPFHLDPSILPKAAACTESITIDPPALRAAKRRKPPLADPDIVGDSRHPNVLG